MVINNNDKKTWETHKRSYKILNAWQLGELYTLPVKLLNPQTGRQKTYKLRVRPCNGETNYNIIGMSAGFIHFEFLDTTVGKRTHGFCGIAYFFKHAKQ